MVREKSHGPDPCFGPPCCRGIAKSADCDPDYDGYDDEPPCGDFCCCCDPCLHDRVTQTLVGAGGAFCPSCCRCVPKWVLVRFTPYDEDQVCRPVVWRVRAEHTATETRYSLRIPGTDNAILKIHRPLDYTSEDGFGPCEWRLTIPDLSIDEAYEIDGRNARCGNIPAIPSIENVAFGQACYDGPPCVGSITFERYEEFKIPYRKRLESGDDPSETMDIECGECLTACKRLCVTRATASEYEDGVIDWDEGVKHDFSWDEYSESWTGGFNLPGGGDECGEESIGLHTDEYGNCYLELLSWSDAMGIFQGDLIEIPAAKCGKRLDVTAVDAEGNYIRIRCGICHCWEFICGECRCVCDTLCVVGGDGGSITGPTSVSWEDDTGGWGEADEYGFGRVNLFSADGSKCDANTLCRATFEGFEDEDNILDVPTKCGSDLSFSAIRGVKAGDDRPFGWRVAWCSQGSPCDGGRCGSGCDSLPAIVMADFEPQAFGPESACVDVEGYDDPVYCFEPFSVPLVLIATGDPEAAYSHYWMNIVQFECTGCYSPGGFVEETFFMRVILTCDGQWEAVVWAHGEDVPPVGPAPGPTPPCEPCDDDPYEEVVEGSFVRPAVSKQCCNEAGYIATLTHAP